MNYIYEYFFSSHLGIIELIASILVLVSVWMCAKQNIWNFLVGAVAVTLYGYIFMSVQLYADMVLQWVYFLPISFYGWWYWYTKGPKKDTLRVRNATNVQVVQGLGILAVGSLVTGYLFATFTPAALPYPDSFILFASVYAQYLLSKKILQSWWIWVAVDAVAIYVYAAKGLYISSGLYAILFVLASYGGFQWYMNYQNRFARMFGRGV